MMRLACAHTPPVTRRARAPGATAHYPFSAVHVRGLRERNLFHERPRASPADTDDLEMTDAGLMPAAPRVRRPIEARARQRRVRSTMVQKALRQRTSVGAKKTEVVAD